MLSVESRNGGAQPFFVIIKTLIAMAMSYLVGAIPTGLLVGKAFAGIDIREHGSGNMGATNVFRVLGKKLGVMVLFLDLMKGLLPVAILPLVLGIPDTAIWSQILIGAAAIIGHVAPVFAGFRGGKGVATAIGVFAGLAPLEILGVAVFGLVVIGLTGYVSAGSLVGAVLLPIAMYFSGQPTALLAVTVLLCALVIVRHRGNIDRMIAGRELRFWDSQSDDEPIRPTDDDGRP